MVKQRVHTGQTAEYTLSRVETPLDPHVKWRPKSLTYIGQKVFDLLAFETRERERERIGSRETPLRSSRLRPAASRPRFRPHRRRPLRFAGTGHHSGNEPERWAAAAAAAAAAAGREVDVQIAKWRGSLGSR